MARFVVCVFPPAAAVLPLFLSSCALPAFPLASQRRAQRVHRTTHEATSCDHTASLHHSFMPASSCRQHHPRLLRVACCALRLGLFVSPLRLPLTSVGANRRESAVCIHCECSEGVQHAVDSHRGRTWPAHPVRGSRPPTVICTPCIGHLCAASRATGHPHDENDRHSVQRAQRSQHSSLTHEAQLCHCAESEAIDSPLPRRPTCTPRPPHTTSSARLTCSRRWTRQSRRESRNSGSRHDGSADQQAALR